jgi:3-deoxy-D-manno-octulosonate 8-phosphate phosphatase (KDO 8-P phosphatase)
MLSDQVLVAVKLIVFDFDGVFTDNTVYVSEQGTESVRCWRGDGLGLSRLQSVGVQACIISTELNPVVTMRARKLKLPCQQGVADKAAAVLATCERLHIAVAETMFVGNDINDIPALKLVGVPVAVADAYQEVLPHVPGGTPARRIPHRESWWSGCRA